MQMLFDANKLALLLRNLYSGHIRYDRNTGVGKAGGKRGTEWIKPANITNLDCSGFVQYVIHETTKQFWKIPGGSVKQRDWFVDNDYLRITTYSSEAPKQDNCVRIAFKDTITIPATATTPKVKQQVGHVWLVINGKTYESTATGGKAIGPKSFPWSDRTNDADDCFFLGQAPNFQMHKGSIDQLYP